jgi:hypothetical protein
MEFELESLTRLAYELYPKVKMEDPPEMNPELKPEYHELLKRISDGKERCTSKWELILQDLKSIYPREPWLEILPGHNQERCIKLQTVLNWKENIPGLVYEEILITYFSLILNSFTFNIKRNLFGKKHGLFFEERTFNIRYEYNQDIENVTRAIQKEFPDYKRFDHELHYIVLPGIEFDDSTYCYEPFANHTFRSMTLFNAFFTSHLH